MLQIGKTQSLTIARTSEFGLFLTNGTDDVLLPRKYAPAHMQIGDAIDVFVLNDSEDRPIATTKKPRAEVDQSVLMMTSEVTSVGAFMDWGMDKDLLIPFREQAHKLEAGRNYVVRVVLDSHTNRLIGSTKITKYLTGNPNELSVGQKVDLLVLGTVPEGVRCSIDNKYFGMLFPDEVFGPLREGKQSVGYIKRIREDGGIALSLSPQGLGGALAEGPSIMEKLTRAGGFLPYGDHTSPDEIRRTFGMSKGTYKKAIGMLLRSGQITIEHHGIRLKEV
jgi:uncharacterized protein